MRPIRTSKTTGIYGAPLGHEDQIGGLPFYRGSSTGVSTVYSVWEFDEFDRKAIAAGGKLVLGILGMEPIPPVSLGIQNGPWLDEVAENRPDPGATPEEQGLTPGGELNRPPKPPAPPANREMG